MEIIVNDYSLDGSFSSLEEFYDSLDNLVKVISLIQSRNIDLKLLKSYELYNRKVTISDSLNEALTAKISRTNDRVRKFKTLLSKVLREPYHWEETPKHKNDDKYICEFTSRTSGYCLAEACERDKIVLSFENTKFSEKNIEINKNNTIVALENIIDFISFCDNLYEKSLIETKEYCLNRYNIDTNLSFEFLEDKYGFETLEKREINTFLSTFKRFSDLDWNQIIKDNGLDYKKYKPNTKNNWFRNSDFNNKEIYKFRTSQLYRCYGYRENNRFFILRFERDHSISDKG